MDGIPDSTDMSLSKLRAMMRDREAWRIAGHGSQRDTTERLSNKVIDKDQESDVLLTRKLWCLTRNR